jgi:hypothetical protein
MTNRPLNDTDLVELSDLGWELVDPEGEHRRRHFRSRPAGLEGQEAR